MVGIPNYKDITKKQNGSPILQSYKSISNCIDMLSEGTAIGWAPVAVPPAC